LPASLGAASGQAFRTLVVVNTNSAESIELGDYYAAAHGIPPHHICRLGIGTNATSITSNDFQTLLLAPITNHIATNGLIGQIDFLVLCQQFPNRIRDTEGVTAALFYGFKNAAGYWDAPTGCKLPAGTSNAYFLAERAFRSADVWNATNGFVAFHLVAFNLATAKLVVDRGAAAQATRPPASINLYNWGDQLRGIREQRFADTQFSFRALPGLTPTSSVPPYYEYMIGNTNAIGYHDGFQNLLNPAFGNLLTNTVWLPGAYADHLTSYGGRLDNLVTGITNNTLQTTVLNWMDAGLTASYGTVAEPCAYLQKFPDPLMGFYYARGFTIGEAYAMAVEAPFQGLFAGDPLAAPYAAPPAISVTSQVPYQIVTGAIPVQVSAAAHSNGAPAAALDFYLNQRFHTNLAALGPTPGNRASVVVGGLTNTYEVATNDTLHAVVAGLAAAVNSNISSVVSARAYGDRLELMYDFLDNAGDHLPVSASTAQGAAAALTLGTGLAATSLVPSVAYARKTLYLQAYSGGANTGDTVQCVITLTNGTVVTNLLVAAQGETAPALLERLRIAISNTPALAGTDGVRFDRLARSAPEIVWSSALFARTPGPDGWPIQVNYTISAISNSSGLRTNTSFASFLSDNPADLVPRASILFHVTPTNGTLAAATVLDTTTLDDGIHTLDFVARDGSAVAAASRLTLPIVVCNSSAQLLLLGTNAAAVADGEAPSLAKGTDFGSVLWDEPRTNVFGLANHGSAPLAITHWTTNGPGGAAFTVSGVPAVIEAGGVSNFTVVFIPATSILYEASLAFESDAVLPQTNLLFSGSGTPRHTLEIISAYGTPDPPAGLHTNWLGAELTNSVAAPAPAGGTQLVCTGWTMTGHEPASGAATNFTMTVTNDATLTWLWTTNYWLDTAAGPNGSVNVPDSWQPAGATTQLTATADLYYEFAEWTGSVAETNNPLELLMDAPKAVQANFTALLATNATPRWWLALHGWTNDFDAAALDDPDEDGYFTWQEYIADTDPTNAASFFPPLGAAGSATNLTFGLDPTSTGRHYFVDVSPLLVAPDWNNATNAPGTGGAWLPEITPPGTGLYFYRGRVTLPP
jgi:uncharacterized protein (TIGR03790 family)